MQILGRIALSVACAVPLCVSAAEKPLGTMFRETQAESKFDRSFFSHEVPRSESSTSSWMVYLFAGDLAKTFDLPKYRVDAAIMPSNTRMQLNAIFPFTQKILLDRVRRHKNEFENLENQVRKIPETDLPMILGTDTFTARLRFQPNSPASLPFPSAVCFIATDNPEGGSIEQRDFFYQRRVRDSVSKCLKSLNALGAKSVAMPLIGAASTGTRDQDLPTARVRALLRCRLINSISGIALGISQFMPERRSIEEIGVIQWDKDIERLFRPPTNSSKEDVATLKEEYAKYAQNSVETMKRALAGQVTTAEQLKDRDCETILGTKSAALDSR
jgi:hypothetical protein